MQQRCGHFSNRELYANESGARSSRPRRNRCSAYRLGILGAAHPNIAVKLLSASFVLTAIAIFAACTLYAVAWVIPAEHALWCRRMLGHSADHRPIAGAIVLAMLASVAIRSFVVARAVTCIWSVEAIGRPPVAVERSEELYAFAVPPTSNSDGSIVVSTSMLDALTLEEQRALFAHERAHLRFSHHRYLLASRVLEGTVGSWNVGRTKKPHATRVLLGFGADSVVDRVEAMLAPVAPTGRSTDFLLSVCAVASAAATVTQIQHLVELIRHMTG